MCRPSTPPVFITYCNCFAHCKRSSITGGVEDLCTKLVLLSWSVNMYRWCVCSVWTVYRTDGLYAVFGRCIVQMVCMQCLDGVSYRWCVCSVWTVYRTDGVYAVFGRCIVQMVCMQYLEGVSYRWSVCSVWKVYRTDGLCSVWTVYRTDGLYAVL